MADQEQQMTAEQVKSANEDEQAKWQGDFKEEDLVIPYKRETQDELSEADKTDGKTSTKSAKGHGEEQPDDEAEATEFHEVEQYSEPVSAITVDNPGDYQPADYSFEVTLKDGKTVKVSTPEEAEKIADDPDNFETPKQLMDFINKQNKMNRNLDKDYEKWESQNKKYTEQVETENQRREAADNLTNEMLYLVDKGMIPDIEDAAAKNRWMTDETASSDKDFVKTPGVREQVELLNYFVKENEKRAKSGVRPLTSLIDAYNGWQLDESHKKLEAKRKSEAEAQRVAGEARKAAGARVAGVSASNQAPYVPKGIAVGNPNAFKRSENIWAD